MAGKFLWPGYGDNLRVLQWMIERVTGKKPARQTPIGYMPAPEDLNLQGLSMVPGAIEALLHVDRIGWAAEMEDVGQFLEEFGKHLPAELESERKRIFSRLQN